MEMNTAVLSIGDFSAITHISVKMLRHYHQIGLLEPADVDSGTGYRATRRTGPGGAGHPPIPRPADAAGADRRRARGPRRRDTNALITTISPRLQADLAETQSAVSSLRDLLERRHRRRRPESTIDGSTHPGRGISEVVAVADLLAGSKVPWASCTPPSPLRACAGRRPGGGLYAAELFTDEVGRATVFVPCDRELRATGRVTSTVIPPVELAYDSALGFPSGHRPAYGALAAHVAEPRIGGGRPDPRVLPRRKERHPRRNLRGGPRSAGRSSDVLWSRQPLGAPRSRVPVRRRWCVSWRAKLCACLLGTPPPCRAH